MTKYICFFFSAVVFTTLAFANDDIATVLFLADVEEKVDRHSVLSSSETLETKQLLQSTTDSKTKARLYYVLGRSAATSCKNGREASICSKAVSTLGRARTLGLSKGRLVAVLEDLMQISNETGRKQAALDYLNTGKNPKYIALAKKILEDKKEESEPPKEIVEVSDVRFWSNPNYTRITLYLSGPVSYQKGTLRANVEAGLPPRLYLDMEGAKLLSSVEKVRAVNDGLLKRIRISQNTKSKVRLVLDFVSMARHQVLQVENPSQIVIDVLGDNQNEAPKVAVQNSIPKIKTKPLIVVDAGHGGKDPGALGPKGRREKNIVLSLAKKTADELKAGGYRVMLTREGDSFLELFERTAIANKASADLFLSIHADAAENKSAYGFSVYFLAEPSDKSAQIVAARENNVKVQALREVDMIMQALTFSFNKNESKIFAQGVHRNVVDQIRPLSPFRDIGVKSAPFYVMYGAQMPSILIESGFVSHSTESAKLQKPEFINGFAKGVKKGVDEYFKGMQKRKL